MYLDVKVVKIDVVKKKLELFNCLDILEDN